MASVCTAWQRCPAPCFISFGHKHAALGQLCKVCRSSFRQSLTHISWSTWVTHWVPMSASRRCSSSKSPSTHSKRIFWAERDASILTTSPCLQWRTATGSHMAEGQETWSWRRTLLRLPQRVTGCSTETSCCLLQKDHGRDSNVLGTTWQGRLREAEHVFERRLVSAARCDRDMQRHQSVLYADERNVEHNTNGAACLQVEAYLGQRTSPPRHTRIGAGPSEQNVTAAASCK